MSFVLSETIIIDPSTLLMRTTLILICLLTVCLLRVPQAQAQTQVPLRASAPSSYNGTGSNEQLPGAEASFQVAVLPASSTFSLVIVNPAKKKLQLQISHKNFGTVVDTTVYTDFKQRYNLSQADDGRYVVEVFCGKEKVVREIELNTVTTRNVVVH